MAVALVTGASGFIGSHLVEALVARGDSVRCLVRPTSSREFLTPLGVRLIEGNVTQSETLERAVAGVDVVYNLAGMITTFRAADQAQVNGVGVENLARICAAQMNPPVHVLVSSIAAGGPAPRDRLRVEADRSIPVSNYGRSKRQGELAAEQWADRVPTTIVRPGIVFGKRDRLLLPMYRSIARFHLHAVAGFRSPRLSFVHAADLSNLLIAAAEKGERVKPPTHPKRPGASVSSLNGLTSNGSTSNGQAKMRGDGYYQACGREYPDYMQFGRMLAQALETRLVVYLPLVEPLPWLVGGCSELGGRVLGRPAPLNIDKIREATVNSWACSGEKAERQLGVSTPRPLAEQLRETVAWYREHGWL